MEKQRQLESHTSPLNKYIYHDNSDGRKIIFECFAENILDADRLYEEKTGKNPEKQSYVGCEIIKAEALTSDDITSVREE